MTGQFIRGIFMMVLATIALAPAAAQPHLEQGVYALPGYALVISEEITPDTLVNFGILVKQNPDLSIVILNSPGGKVYPAMVIAEMIHKHGLSTAVIEGSLCASACSIIFLAGKARLALGDLGVHQISGVSDPSLTQSTISDIYSSLTTFGTHPKVIELMLKTPPDEMYYFSRQELVDYGLNRKVDGAAIGDKTAEQAEIPIIETEMLAHRNFKDWRVAKYLNKKHNLEFITLETISGEPRVGIVTYPVSGRFFIEIYWESAHFTRGSENITIQFRRNDGHSRALLMTMDRHEGGYERTISSADNGIEVDFYNGLIYGHEMDIYDSRGVLLARKSLAGSMAASNFYMTAQ